MHSLDDVNHQTELDEAEHEVEGEDGAGRVQKTGVRYGDRPLETLYSR